jgi:hypothetical protein
MALQVRLFLLNLGASRSQLPPEGSSSLRVLKWGGGRHGDWEVLASPPRMPSKLWQLASLGVKLGFARQHCDGDVCLAWRESMSASETVPSGKADTLTVHTDCIPGSHCR